MKTLESICIVAVAIIVLMAVTSCNVIREIERIHWMNSGIPYFEVPLYTKNF